MTILQFIGLVSVAFVVTLVLIKLGLWLAPGFKSREKKAGTYRAEDIRHLPATSTKLPTWGGTAAAVGISVALIVAHYAGISETDFRWFLVPTWTFALFGLVDDILKWRSRGMSERARMVCIVLAAFTITAAFYFRLHYDKPYPPFAYVSYFLIPAIWFIWFFVFTTGLTAVTVISVGFTDGIDGLLGGLWLIGSIVYSILTLVNGAWIGAAISAAMVGGSLAFLSQNLPSNWSAKQSVKRRKAKVYAGESGALLVGAAFSVLALLTATEFHWFLIGGVFALEGMSALYQAKIATPIFRRFLVLPKFSSDSFVPHTDFPLPFLATPLHCHLDLLGLGRLTVVMILYTLAVVFGFLGLWAIFTNEFTVKVLVWIAGIGLMLLVWIGGMWTRTVFLAPVFSNGQSTRLGLYQGRPLQFWWVRLYWLREALDIDTEDIEPYLEQFPYRVLWQPMLHQEARATIGEIYYALGKEKESLASLDLVPINALKIRPQAWRIFCDLQHKSSLNHNAGVDGPVPETRRQSGAVLTFGPQCEAGAVSLEVPTDQQEFPRI